MRLLALRASFPYSTYSTSTLLPHRTLFHRQLSLSTNSIDRLIPLGGMSNLKILSMGRNVLKRIERLEEVRRRRGGEEKRRAQSTPVCVHVYSMCVYSYSGVYVKCGVTTPCTPPIVTHTRSLSPPPPPPPPPPPRLPASSPTVPV